MTIFAETVFTFDDYHYESPSASWKSKLRGIHLNAKRCPMDSELDALSLQSIRFDRSIANCILN